MSGSHALLTVVAAGAAAVAAAALLPGRAPRPAGLRRPPSAAAPAGRDLPVLPVSATVAVGLGTAVLLGGSIGLVAGLVAGAVCWRVVGGMESPAIRRRRERLAAAAPHVVDLMAACLAAGLSPGSALEQITEAVEAPVRDELAAVSARLRLGVDPVTVWSDLGGHPQLGALGRSLARATVSGASVADAMQRLSEDLRRSARADVESRARAVGVKAAVPLGVCLLPAFVLVGVVPLVAGSVSVLTGP